MSSKPNTRSKTSLPSPKAGSVYTSPRYLTKSRFKLGMECPAKLYYTRKEEEYANENLEDSFLAALAEGGFQVGELAKLYFPGGTDIKSLGYEEALAQTNELLQNKDAIIYEAAVRFGTLFIRTDILVKRGDSIELIEVKAKSFDREEDRFIGSKGGISSAWKPYLYDVVFQRHVVSQAFPKFKVKAYLMLADKSAACPSDGLHQKFRIVKDTGGTKPNQRVVVKPLSPLETKERILVQLNVDRECDLILKNELDVELGPTSFVDRIQWLAEHYERDEKIICRPSPVCGGCEFRATAEEEARGLKSGFKECWKAALRWKEKDFAKPNVLNIWNYKGKAKMMAENRIAIDDVTEDDIGPKDDGKPGLSMSERQWLQVEKAQQGDSAIWVDREGLRREMALEVPAALHRL